MNSALRKEREESYHTIELNEITSFRNEISEGLTLQLVRFWFFNVFSIKGELCTRFCWGNLRERDHWGDGDVDGRIILRWILRKWEEVVGTGWSWLRIGTGGGRLCVR